MLPIWAHYHSSQCLSATVRVWLLWTAVLLIGDESPSMQVSMVEFMANGRRWCNRRCIVNVSERTLRCTEALGRRLFDLRGVHPSTSVSVSGTQIQRSHHASMIPASMVMSRSLEVSK
jgi:hypothetical protein